MWQPAVTAAAGATTTKERRMGRLLRPAAGLGLALGGLAAVNAVLALRAGPVQHDLPGVGRYWVTPEGDLFTKVHGQGRPVVLLHGIHAAASAFEMRKLMPALAADHEVHALDLLGFGLSDRPARAYDAELYIGLIARYLREVVGRPADLVASSLTAAFVIQVADRWPALVRRLVLIVPTGLEQRRTGPGAGGWLVRRLGGAPVLGQALFNALVSRAGLRWFLANQVYYNDSYVTSALVDAYYATAHQPGARWAPLAFLAGDLDCDVRAAWPRLTQPALVVWGRQALLSPVRYAETFVRLRPATALTIFERCGLLPHDEHAAAFVQLARRHLDGHAP
jgi:pimeloyl-ACP methyl ester carboxylesterase